MANWDIDLKLKAKNDSNITIDVIKISLAVKTVKKGSIDVGVHLSVEAFK